MPNNDIFFLEIAFSMLVIHSTVDLLEHSFRGTGVRSVAIGGSCAKPEPTARELSNCTCNDSLWPLRVDGKVFYRRCGKDSFQVHGNDFFLTRDKE